MSTLALTKQDRPASGEFPLTSQAFGSIADIVRKECGIDLGDNKMGLVKSRLQKRLRQLGMRDFSQYVEFLRSDRTGDELGELVSAISTNVTKFNREAHHFEHFRQVVVPPLIERLRRSEKVLLWSAGCSNGSEPYTLACIMLDMFPDVVTAPFRILATDIDKQSLRAGVSGLYQPDMISSLSEKFVSKHFNESEGKYQISDSAKKLVTFRPLNLMSDWPMRKLYDALFCRNVLIYFSPEDQERLYQRFLGRLKPGAFLYIGHSERVTGPALDHLRSVGATTYQKTAGQAKT